MTPNTMINKRNRTVASLLALLLVLYCSVGVCTSLLADIGVSTAVTVATDADPHAHHRTSSAASTTDGVSMAAHCAESESSCNWSLNSIPDQLGASGADSLFYAFYPIAALTILLALLLWASQRSRRVAYDSDHLHQFNYPRLHLQKAVFLN